MENKIAHPILWMCIIHIVDKYYTQLFNNLLKEYTKWNLTKELKTFQR